MRYSIADLIHMHEEIAASLDTSQPNQNDFRFAAFGTILEIGEAFEHLPWRPWRASDNHIPTAHELTLALPELADAMGALLRCIANLGINAEIFEQACIKHVEEKWRRISVGIDR